MNNRVFRYHEYQLTNNDLGIPHQQQQVQQFDGANDTSNNNNNENASEAQALRLPSVEDSKTNEIWSRPTQLRTTEFTRPDFVGKIQVASNGDKKIQYCVKFKLYIIARMKEIDQSMYICLYMI